MIWRFLIVCCKSENFNANKFTKRVYKCVNKRKARKNEEVKMMIEGKWTFLQCHENWVNDWESGNGCSCVTCYIFRIFVFEQKKLKFRFFGIFLDFLKIVVYQKKIHIWKKCLVAKNDGIFYFWALIFNVSGKNCRFFVKNFFFYW